MPSPLVVRPCHGATGVQDHDDRRSPEQAEIATEGITPRGIVVSVLIERGHRGGASAVIRLGCPAPSDQIDLGDKIKQEACPGPTASRFVVRTAHGEPRSLGNPRWIASLRSLRSLRFVQHESRSHLRLTEELAALHPPAQPTVPEADKCAHQLTRGDQRPRRRKMGPEDRDDPSRTYFY